MVYEVSRTSLWNDEVPCEEAEWKDGKWYVTFADPLDLIAFVAKYNMVVLTTRKIEIYDTWRE